MEVRTMQRSGTLSNLNKKTMLKTAKLVKGKSEDEKQNKEFSSSTSLSVFHKHPAFKYIRNTQPTLIQFKKFTTLLYKGLFYAINNLKGPSQEYINKKKVKLPETQDSKKKFLIMDLDQTLIHSVFTNEKTDVKFTHKGDQFKFNVRPHCFQFLSNLSEYYSIYVFTAGTQDYAEPIVAYLNQKKKTIMGLLHRKNCMQTQNGFFIKDLRIVANRELKDIVMVDNLVHSFGLQINNGVPILEFLDNSEDNELKAIEPLLIEASTFPDSRDCLEQRLALKKVIEITETQYLDVQEYTTKKM